MIGISTHTPLAGRDCLCSLLIPETVISTHTPLAGRDGVMGLVKSGISNFYSHAPRGT